MLNWLSMQIPSGSAPNFRPKIASTPGPSPEIAAEPQKEWTVLYYGNGCNDLEPFTIRSVRDLEKVGSSDQVHLAAQMSRGDQYAIYGNKPEKTNIDGDWVGMRRYHICKAPKGSRRMKSPILHSQNQPPNHGEAQTLADFVAWGMRKFPAKHTILIIGDHGRAFMGTGLDHVHKDHLELAELNTALSSAAQEVGRKPDMLVFDSCEMANLEVAHHLKDCAQVLVGTEELLGADGLPWVSFLKDLSKNAQDGPQSQAKHLVELSGQDEINRLKNGQFDAACQLSAIDLSKVEQLSSAVSQLSQQLQKSALAPQTITGMIRDTLRFGEGGRALPDRDFRDLGDFCQQILQEPDSEKSLQKAANKVLKAIPEAILAHQNEGQGMERAQGISIYLPDKPIPEKFTDSKRCGNFREQYSQTQFDRDTGWSDWQTHQ